jgi:hypothetical protein
VPSKRFQENDNEWAVSPKCDLRDKLCLRSIIWPTRERYGISGSEFVKRKAQKK